VAVFVKPISWATETNLKRETVNQVEFFPHDYSCSGLSTFLNIKVAGVEAKMLSVLVEEQRKDPFLQTISF